MISPVTGTYFLLIKIEYSAVIFVHPMLAHILMGQVGMLPFARLCNPSRSTCVIDDATSQRLEKIKTAQPTSCEVITFNPAGDRNFKSYMDTEKVMPYIRYIVDSAQGVETELPGLLECKVVGSDIFCRFTDGTGFLVLETDRLGRPLLVSRNGINSGHAVADAMWLKYE